MRPKYSNEGGSFLMIRDEHLLVTGGNVVAAALIHIFEHWHYHKLAQNQQNREANEIAEGHHDKRRFTETLYQWHTSANLELQLKGIGKKDSIIAARKLLVELGIISEHKNPNPSYRYDKTIHFIFHESVLAELIFKFYKPSSSENRQGPSGKTDEATSENRQYPYISSIDNISIDSNNTAADAPVGEAPRCNHELKMPKKKKAPGAADANWQRWVDAWHDFFKNRHDDIPPAWNGTQLASLKRLRVYLCKVATQVDGKTADDCGFGAWSYILDNWDRLDDWQRQQFDLSVVNQKINNILTQLKNGTTTHRSNYAGGNGKPSPGAARFEAIKNY
jgi:hypothetical protein